MSESSQSSIAVRPATCGDVPGLTALCRATAGLEAALTGAGPEGVPDPGTVADHVKEEVGGLGQGGVLLVAESGGDTRGCARVRLLDEVDGGGAPRARLEVTVLLGGDSEEVARRLVERAESWAAAQGVGTLQLECHPANEAAVDFYTRACDYQPSTVVLTKSLRARADRPVVPMSGAR